VREDQAVDGEADPAGSALPVAEGGPLRGEKPKESPVDEWSGRGSAGAGAGGRPKAVRGGKTQQRRVGLPDDLRLRVALGPVSRLWERLSGWQQDQVEAAAKAELAQLAGLGVAPDGAPRLLAGRLTDRLEETGGEARVDKPFPWLIRRGLPQRRACSHHKCDDGVRLDTGEDCENCGNVIHLRRALRARIGADIDRELPGLDEGERRRVLEERLREQAAIEAEDLVWRREQAAAERARREAARAADLERAEAERAAAAAAEAARQALPCTDCGQPQSGGLCETCDCRRQTKALVVEAGLVAAAWSAALDDPGNVAGVVTHVQAELDAGIDGAWREFLELVEPGELESDPARAALAQALTALQVVEQAVPEYRRRALAMLARAPEAEAEAERAYATEQRRRWFRANPNGADALTAAAKAADAARERTAQFLLEQRVEQLREHAPCAPRPPGR
jgi:hypothetical protein